MNTRLYTEYIAALYRHAPNADPDTAQRLQRIASSLHRIFERQCNGYPDWRGEWDEQAEKRDEKREKRLTAEAYGLAEALGAKLYLQGDPRGWPLYLYFLGQLGYDNPKADGGWHGVGIPPR